MRQTKADQILNFFFLARELGVECVVTNYEQRESWAREIGKKFNLVYDQNYINDKDSINGVEIRYH